jgi:putative peptidoglycan lipid II flippase
MDGLKIKSNSTSKSVFFSTFFSLIARVFSFVQAMIVSCYFGATKSTDFLFFCISITMLLPGLFNCINQSVIVPNAIRIREKKSEEDSRRFISTIYFLYLVAGILICAAISLVPEEFMLLVSKFERPDVKENIRIVQLIIPTFFFTLTNSYLLDIFNSYKYFTLPMILDMLKSILIILFIVLLGKKYGVVSMAAGILIAQIIQFVLLNGFLIKLFGFRFKFRLYRLDKELERNIFFVVISQVSTILSQYVAIYLISGLNKGVYTALSYSDKLYNIFVLIFADQVSTVIGIDMIELYARKEYEKLNRQYLKCLKGMMTIILPICFIMAVQAPLVISVIFERGFFTSESVLLTSIFFKYTILIIPLLLMDRLIVRLIIAKQILHISLIWNVISKILTCAVVFIIVEYIDFKYYALGLLLVQFIYIILINLFMIKKQFKFINVKSSLLYVAVNTILCAVLCLSTYKIFPTQYANGIWQKLAALCTYSILVMGSYYLIGFISFNRETILQLLQYLRQLMPGQLKAEISHTDKLL